MRFIKLLVTLLIALIAVSCASFGMKDTPKVEDIQRFHKVNNVYHLRVKYSRVGKQQDRIMLVEQVFKNRLPCYSDSVLTIKEYAAKVYGIYPYHIEVGSSKTNIAIPNP